MSRFTIVNFFEDVADSSSEAFPGVEGRFARRHLDSEHLGVSYFHYAPGVRAPKAHHHREQEEAYVVIAGSGRIKLDDDVRELRLVEHRPRQRRRRPRDRGGRRGAGAIAVGSDRPEGGDGVTVAADWPD